MEFYSLVLLTASSTALGQLSVEDPTSSITFTAKLSPPFLAKFSFPWFFKPKL